MSKRVQVINSFSRYGLYNLEDGEVVIPQKDWYIYLSEILKTTEFITELSDDIIVLYGKVKRGRFKRPIIKARAIYNKTKDIIHPLLDGQIYENILMISKIVIMENASSLKIDTYSIDSDIFHPSRYQGYYITSSEKIIFFKDNDRLEIYDILEDEFYQETEVKDLYLGITTGKVLNYHYDSLENKESEDRVKVKKIGKMN